MRPYARFLGSGRDDNGIPCRFYESIPPGTTYRAYDLEALLKAEEARTREALNRGKVAPITSAASYHKRRFVRR